MYEDTGIYLSSILTFMFWLTLNMSSTLSHYDFSVLNKDHQLFVSKMIKGLNQRYVGALILQLTNPGKSPHHSFCAFQPNALLDPFDTFPKSCFWNPFTFFFGLAGFLPGRVTSLLSFTLALKIEFSSSSSPLLRQRCCVIPASSDQCLYKKHCQPPSPSSIPVPPLRLFFFFF